MTCTTNMLALALIVLCSSINAMNLTSSDSYTRSLKQPVYFMKKPEIKIENIQVILPKLITFGSSQLKMEQKSTESRIKNKAIFPKKKYKRITDYLLEQQKRMEKMYAYTMIPEIKSAFFTYVTELDFSDSNIIKNLEEYALVAAKIARKNDMNQHESLIAQWAFEEKYFNRPEKAFELSGKVLQELSRALHKNKSFRLRKFLNGLDEESIRAPFFDQLYNSIVNKGDRTEESYVNKEKTEIQKSTFDRFFPGFIILTVFCLVLGQLLPR